MGRGGQKKAFPQAQESLFQVDQTEVVYLPKIGMFADDKLLHRSQAPAMSFSSLSTALVVFSMMFTPRGDTFFPPLGSGVQKNSMKGLNYNGLRHDSLGSQPVRTMRI